MLVFKIKNCIFVKIEADKKNHAKEMKIYKSDIKKNVLWIGRNSRVFNII